jgi:Cu2+-exporting ATPase
MLAQVFALGSTVALASGLAVRRPEKRLRQKLSPLRDRHTNAAQSWGFSSEDRAGNVAGAREYRNGIHWARVPVPMTQQIYQRAKNGVLALKKVLVIGFGGSQLRDQHLDQLSSGQRLSGQDTTEKKLDSRIKASVAVMGLAVVGCLAYPPLLRVAGAGSLYIFVPVFQELSKNLKRGRITTELLEIVSLISFLVSGYFFLAAFVSFLALLNFKLLKRTEEHSHDVLIDAFAQTPHSIWVIDDGVETKIPLTAVWNHATVVVHAGEMIPVDGTISEGHASVDQQSLTGEAQPLEVGPEDKVFATTILLTGRILIQAERTGSETNAARIGKILEHTQLYKESVRLRGKHIADGFIAPTLFVSSLTLPLLGPNAAMAILWSGFGYNMKLYGPITVLNFLHIMAKNGVLIKDGRSLEMLMRVDTVVFDKTGTLTVEQPQLGRIYACPPFDERTVLTYAAAAECRQTHPIARAILRAAQKQDVVLPVIEHAAYQVGYGIEVNVEGNLVRVGSSRFMQQEGISFGADVKALQQRSDASGNSLVYVAVNDAFAGVLELEPSIRPEAKRVVNYLKAKGIDVYIISGDHEEPTRRLAESLGIENYFSQTLPVEKADLVSGLRADGRFVGYIGDGINDAIALKQANVSMSLRGASTAATDTAQIVLMDGDLAQLDALFEIADAFEADMHANYLNSVVPGVIALGGIFVLKMGLAWSMSVYFSSKIFALMRCMRPLVEDEAKHTGPSHDLKDDKGKGSTSEPLEAPAHAAATTCASP